MALFKKEKPNHSITLKDLYPEDADQIEDNLTFDVFDAGQRTFRRHWFRVARTGHLPKAMFGQGDEQQALVEFTSMLANEDGFEAAFDLVSKGVIADAHWTNGSGDQSLSGLDAEGREKELRGLFDEESELLLQLLMVPLVKVAERMAEAKETAKKSSASSRAKRGSKGRKSAE